MEFDLLKRILEAALLAAPQPLTVAQLGDLFGEDEAPPADDIRRAIYALQQDCDGRGVELLEVASGFRYQVRSEVYPHIARLWAEKPSRYSRALLETLVLIAYRQPITRGEIEAIRGVAVTTQIIRTLEEREWIRVVGHRDVPGKPALFGTTRGFLDYFNLKSLDQLPALSALLELPELEPELDFDGARVIAQMALPAATAAAGTHVQGDTDDIAETDDTGETRSIDEMDDEIDEIDEIAEPNAERSEATAPSGAVEAPSDPAAEDTAATAAGPDAQSALSASLESQHPEVDAAVETDAPTSPEIHAAPDCSGAGTDDPAAAAADSPTGEPDSSPEQIP